MNERDLETTAATLLAALERAGAMAATAESCTGGMIAQAMTSIAGSSRGFERGFVTYSNAAKVELLGVEEAVLRAHGAVSEPTARAMATGALAASRAQIALSVTGIAGPDGGGADKPVGLVHFAIASALGVEAFRRVFEGDRRAVRIQAADAGLRALLAAPLLRSR